MADSSHSNTLLKEVMSRVMAASHFQTYFGKLPLAHTVAIENDPLRFARRRGASCAIEFEQQVVDHVLHVFNIFLLRPLNADLANVLGSFRVDTSHHGGNRRLARILLVRAYI